MGKAAVPAGTKHDILKLLFKQELSAQRLATALAVSPAAVRQHLETLEAMGLVERRKLVTQPSRPTFLYRLSANGARIFPKRYDLLLALMVEVVGERHGAQAVSELIEAAARRLAARAGDRLHGKGERERWKALVDWLEEELAWQATVVGDGGARSITIHQCPFQDVSSESPEVCSVFFTTLIRALNGDVSVEAMKPPPPACCAVKIDARG